MAKNRRIDLHYHIIPGPYVQALAQRGIHGSTYVKFPRWTPQTALKHQDRTQVRTAITSLSSPGVWFDDAALAKDLSRLCNEFQAGMMADHPHRFGSLATLPLPDVDLALRELEYALDTLKHDGVCLLSDLDGRYLGHPDLEELFAELDRRKAVVFIHPHDDPRTHKRYEVLSPILEWPIHTTRAAMDLLYSGRLSRYPNIRYILAHGGGVMPFLAHRIVQAYEDPASGPGAIGLPPMEREAALAALGRFFLDTASPGQGHFAALQAFTTPNRLLFGTDGGWTPPIQTKQTIQALQAYDGFGPEELASIEHRNAEALFPRFQDHNAEAPVVEEAWSKGVLSTEIITNQTDKTSDLNLYMIPEMDRDALASLPFPELEVSLAQVARALDTQGMEGVILPSSVDGLYVGDPEFEPLLELLDSRKALVLLHPSALIPEDPNAPLYPWTELPLDLARAYARLVLNECFVRFPNIRWVLSHAGGGVPFLAERLGKLHYLKGERLAWGRIIRDLLTKQNSGFQLATRVSYQITEAGDEVALAALARIVGPDNILMGSSDPWISSAAVPHKAGETAEQQEREG